MTPETDRVAVAGQMKWRGRLVWIPPRGNPYFVDRNPAQDMTEEELRDFRAENGTLNPPSPSAPRG